MKSLLLLAFVFASAFANARPYTQAMSCEEAADLVNSRGAVVMNYAYSERAGWLYSRFVRSRNFCDSHETTQQAWVKTNNSDSCFIGYTCIHRDNGN